MTPAHAELPQIRDTLLKGCSFLLTSHARPDGDSLGSQLALAEALRQLGKQVRIINADPAPDVYAFLPDLSTIEIAASVEDSFDAVVILECSDLSRAGVGGLEGRPLINIDHHPGNAMYGDINWHDVSACACAEMVFELVTALGAHITPAIATDVYVAILTDTGSFRHANITARTFEICRQIAETGIDPAAVAAHVFNNGSLGRLRLTGILLDRMRLEHHRRIAVLAVNDAMLTEAGCDPDDLEGIVNLPLAAQRVRAVVFFKETDKGLRVSLRSKEGVDVRQVAVSFGGGGHLNAAGFTVEHLAPDTRGQILARVATAITGSDE
ncbi:MAG: bifunctional oligoribonuclease/PAP phosphatase NrnA [Vicinamibacterales bacterium]|jgi:phosphoesterase RecJ-like protein|nr:bifunctional oligoribonuclease/PAP phosphatase NrnA [Vicinamibacterales bacterium]